MSQGGGHAHNLFLPLCADTFASKVAAIGDDSADNSVGNVTGSNAVNVFLGVGIAWSIAAIYWESQGMNFEVQPGRQVHFRYADLKEAVMYRVTILDVIYGCFLTEFIRSRLMTCSVSLRLN